MGLLDEAIREHLDLKRRRGADPVEVSRQEQEALGPVRREPEAPLAGTAEGAGPEPYDGSAEAGEAPDSEPANGGARAEEWGFDEDDEPADGDTEPESDEDVLEETPDFLQETPEHDRLWFEQKPPRDFDFDD
jgi:hypothetical protein